MTPSHPTTASVGERMLQQTHGTAARAQAFYDRQVHDHLTPAMHDFITRRTMFFLATADGLGHCDGTLRAGPPGFVVPLDDTRLIFPEYRGNGVMASTGNLLENPRLALLFVDFTDDHIGLHVNGTARLLHEGERAAQYTGLTLDDAPGRAPQMWVHVTVEETYLHCSRNIPHLQSAPRPRRPADRPRDSDYFRTPSTSRPAVSRRPQ